MNIGLLKNGKFKFYKKEKDLLRDSIDMKYILVDNSTELKGPIYSIVKAEEIISKDDIVSVEIHFFYTDLDSPIHDTKILSNTIEIKSIDNRYSIEPLINLIHQIDLFKDELYYGPCIDIDVVLLHFKDGTTLDITGTSESKLNKRFRKYNMLTYADSVLDIWDQHHRKHIIFKNDEWYISDEIPNKFDYIGLSLYGSKVIYFMSYKKFKRLSTIKYMRVGIKDTAFLEVPIETPEIILGDINSDITIDATGADSDYYDNEETNFFSCKNFIDALSACLYYPQFMLIEKFIYNSVHQLTIDVDLINGFKYSLSITADETKYGICLFDILNKLLKI